MTIAVADAILRCAAGEWDDLPQYAVSSMQSLGRRYPHGYGGSFAR